MTSWLQVLVQSLQLVCVSGFRLSIDAAFIETFAVDQKIMDRFGKVKKRPTVHFDRIGILSNECAVLTRFGRRGAGV